MVSGQDELDSADLEGGTDRRRAKMADVLRLEQAMLRAEGATAEMKRLLEQRDTQPISRTQFYATFFGNAAINNPSKAKHFRSWCDEAWAAYQHAMSGAPRVSIEDMNKPFVEPVAAPLTPPAFKEPEFVSVAAEPARA